MASSLQDMSKDAGKPRARVKIYRARPVYGSPLKLASRGQAAHTR